MNLMELQDSRFTALERAVFSEICRMHPADKHILEVQLSAARFRSRENTGAGFYTYFTVDHAAGALLGSERKRDGPYEVEVEGVEHGMGFILWLEEGYANCLEGYCNVGSTEKIDFENVKFKLG